MQKSDRTTNNDARTGGGVLAAGYTLVDLPVVAAILALAAMLAMRSSELLVRRLPS